MKTSFKALLKMLIVTPLDILKSLKKLVEKGYKYFVSNFGLSLLN